MFTVKRLPNDYRWATRYEEDYPDNIPDPIMVMIRASGTSEPYMAVPAALPFPCVREFGEHECAGDNCEAEAILYDMNAPVPDDGFAYAYNRGMEEEMLGRPLYPNEY